MKPFHINIYSSVISNKDDMRMGMGSRQGVEIQSKLGKNSIVT
jgi:hypothetical protein